MTKRGVKELYMWLTASWPLVIRPGAGEAFQNAKLEELYETFQDYTDEQVLAAFHKWTEENEKYPTTKNIINEIKWARVRKSGKPVDPTERYTMEIIEDDGTEYMVMWNGKASFTLEEFMNMPRNKDHLTPDEWERRFKARRKQVLDNLRRQA